MPINQNQLMSNEFLAADQFLSSLSGNFTLVYQGDGNLVLYKNYRNGGRKWLWDSETNGRPVGRCVMQGDGNMLIYGPNGEYVWDTATDRQPGSRLVVQDDGNVVIYRSDGTPIWASNTVQQAVPTGPLAQGDDMQPGEVLNPDQSITSLNGSYTFVYQCDGNLVLYKNYRANNCGSRDRRVLWASNTNGRPVEVCIMQGDGNLVIYGPDGEYIWDTATDRQPGSRLVVQDDGNVVIYRSDGTPIWASNTVQQTVPTGPLAQGDDMQPSEVLNPDQSITSPSGRYTFVYQCDGNLVLYRTVDRIPLWASNTNGRPAEVCIMQGDGNLVIYGPDGEYIWDTATDRQPGSRLVVQDDGNVVIFNTNNRIIWSTDTAAPLISNFTPTSAQIGDSITIEGNNFVRVQRVLFNNVSARYSANSRTRITATVPDSATSGPITVIAPVGSARSGSSFVIVPTPPPIINGFTPSRGRVGTGVTITGGNFSHVTSVQFNGASGNFSIKSDSTISTTVPLNASDGPITVINRGGSATSGNSFDVDHPANLAFINTGMTPTEWPRVGQPFTVWFSFYNGGGTPTGNFSIRLQLDNGAAYQNISAPSFNPGTGDVVYWQFPNGLSVAGSHWFYAYLDINNQVAELSETDNFSYHGFSVTA